MKRFLSVVTAALILGALAGTTAQASVRPAQRTQIWEKVCEAAGGELSPQEALVCVHSGFPMFSSGDLSMLRRTCEHALGGDFVYRSEFPVELGACFFD
jgi:hypothetical protein